MDQVSAIASKQAGLFCTVIDVDFAKGALPTIRALASKTALGQRLAACPIGARIALLRAGISCYIAVITLVSFPTETFKLPGARQILAHGSVRTGAFNTV